MEYINMRQFLRVLENLPYAAQSPRQVLDIIFPERTGNIPFLVVFIHGGGWIHSDKRESVIKNVFSIVSQGYAVATIEYRFSDEALWPAQLYDVKTAIRFLRNHAEEYGYRAEKLLVWGNSAGAHLCQMLAATGKHPELEDLAMGYPDESSEVQGLISWYGISNMLTMDVQCDWIFHGTHKIRNWDRTSHSSLLFGKSIEDDPEQTRAACPIMYVTRDFPVALFQHGTKDRIVPHYQSVEMVLRIIECCGNDRATLELFENADHGAAVIKSKENIVRCLRFIDDFYGVSRDYAKVKLPDIICG